ncbi:MAG TPA: SUMF1/EgtB/PvdO family nonheme iron enzyme [Flavobacteriales bacterium]|nr:SUMF1/EgtB/PvdO family nonheme iron enzyme [Flavobacteriales bacterium]
MTLKGRIAVLLVITILRGRAQDVLDAVYTRPIVKVCGTIYPIPLHFVFADDNNFRNTLHDKITEETNKKYPEFTDMLLVNYPLMYTRYIIGQDSAHAKANAKRTRQEVKNKKSKPFKNTNDGTVKDSKNQKTMLNCHDMFERWLPHANLINENLSFPFLRYYIKNVSVKDSLLTKYLYADVKPFLKEFLSPYYMKKTEVSNAEYRKFVHWVRDSIVRTLLIEAGFEEFRLHKTNEDGDDDGLVHLNWKTSLKNVFGIFPNKEYAEVIEQMYIPANERYYRRKEFDVYKFRYDYVTNDTGNESRIIIPVYPDTACWYNDIPIFRKDLYGNPRINMYFWHPAYDHYPVVGLNVAQIKAYLHWKTKMHNQELKRKKMNYTVSYELPNGMQWELAAGIAQTQVVNYIHHYIKLTDNSYLFNLMLQAQQDTVPLGITQFLNRRLEMKGTIDPNYACAINLKSNQVFDLYFFGPDQGKWFNRKGRKATEPKNIINMNNNVSEWTSQVAVSEYLDLLKLRWYILESYKSNELSLLAQTEKMHYEQTTSGTQLVRGANWFDERTSEIEGINAKCLADPKKGYSTVGFRYVMKIHFPDK